VSWSGLAGPNSRLFAVRKFDASILQSGADGIDYTAVRERLASITSDPNVLAGLDRIRDTGDLDDAFMRTVVEQDISLDWLLLGKGRPFTGREVA
jgi:hypothetical protein